MITYHIYKNGVKIAETTELVYRATGLNPNTRYEFSVIALDEDGNPSNASEVAVVRTPSPADIVRPSTIADLAAVAASSTQINLTWSAATDDIAVVGYQIKRNGLPIDTTTATSYSDVGLNSGTTYFYNVSAYDATPNFGIDSNTAVAMTNAAADTIAPTIPTGLTVTVTGSTTLRADWNASTDAVGVVGYKVYKDGAFVANVTGGALTYSLTGLSASTSYAISVAAYDAVPNVSAACSPVSATTSAGVDTTKPTAPGTPSIAVISSSRLDLSWTASTDAVGVTGYNIYRDKTLSLSDTTLRLLNTSATNSYSDTGLFASTQYTYKVEGFDAAGNVSDPSATASGTTSAAADTTKPSIPGSLVATVAGANQINLTWTASTDNIAVTGYRIYRGTNTSKVGYVGASISQYTVLGAKTLGATRFWNDNLGYGGGGLYKWSQNLTNTNAYWAAFNTAYQANPTNIIWLQLCAIASDAANETNAAGLAVCNEIKARIPGVTIYVSSQPDYVSAPCSIAGSGGPARMAGIVSYLTGLADPQILAGPTFPDLLASEVQADGCHQDADGQATDGQLLINFFNTVGLTALTTSATNSYSNTGLTANTAYSYGVTAYDAAGNESTLSNIVTATTQAETGAFSKRAVGIYAVKGPRDSTLIVNKSFVNGYVHRVGWSSLNTADNTFNFTSIDSALDSVIAVGQSLSLVIFAIQPPAYVVSGASATFQNSFYSQNPTQPVPWDNYALTEWEQFWLAFGNHTHNGYEMRNHPNIKQVDCGIIGLQGVRFITPPTGYVYATFEAAVKRALHAVADQFPSKNLYYGMFGTGTGSTAGDAKKVRDAIAAEFNGVAYPRMAVYQETWTGSVPTAATGQLLYDVRNQPNTPVMLQACGEFGNQSAWPQCNFPAGDNLQSAANYAMNNFNSTYLEIYNSDLNATGNQTICQTIADALLAKYNAAT